MTVEVKPEEVRNTPNPGVAYSRLHAKNTWKQIHASCGGVPVNSKTLSDPETREAAMAAGEDRRNFVKKQEDIDRHASGWPQF